MQTCSDGNEIMIGLWLFCALSGLLVLVIPMTEKGLKGRDILLSLVPAFALEAVGMLMFTSGASCGASALMLLVALLACGIGPSMAVVAHESLERNN